MGLSVPSVAEFWLPWTCVSKSSFCVLTTGIAVTCPEDSNLQHSFFLLCDVPWASVVEGLVWLSHLELTIQSWSLILWPVIHFSIDQFTAKSLQLLSLRAARVCGYAYNFTIFFFFLWRGLYYRLWLFRDSLCMICLLLHPNFGIKGVYHHSWTNINFGSQIDQVHSAKWQEPFLF